MATGANGLRLRKPRKKILAIDFLYSRIVICTVDKRTKTQSKYMDTNTVAVVTDFGNKLDGYIAVLAEKAGVAVDHLWPVLAQQQVVEGWGGVGLFVLSAVMMVIAITLLFKCLPKNNEDYLSPKPFVGCIIGAVCGAVFLISTCINVVDLPKNVAKIYNPEFYAMQSLVNMVK